jgi:hypothetical protein
MSASSPQTAVLQLMAIAKGKLADDAFSKCTRRRQIHPHVFAASSSSLVSFAYPSHLDIRILDNISCFFPAGNITFVLPGLPASFGAVDQYSHGGRREFSAGENPAKGPLAYSMKYSLQRNVAPAMHPDTRMPLTSSYLCVCGVVYKHRGNSSLATVFSVSQALRSGKCVTDLVPESGRSPPL